METDETKSEIALLMEKILEELGDLKLEVRKINETISRYGEMIQKPEPLRKTLKPIKSSGEGIKACYETLNVIKEFELKYQRGVTADEIAQLRNLSRPTIYTHLDELEEANLVFSRRGSIIGLEPHNASFYYVSDRSSFPTLYDQNLFSELTIEEQKVARKIIASAVGKDKGVSFEELRDQLKFEEKLLDSILKILLRRTLIEFYQEGLVRKYIPRTVK
ncbi:MAG: hypothetical protein ACTSPG_02325 [Candidatus Hodarchaeales archaeon]